MTTAPPVRPEAIALPSAGTGERQRRRYQRRRLGREQLLVVVLMFLALVITVAVLALQWMTTNSGTGVTKTGALHQGLEPPVAGILLPSASA